MINITKYGLMSVLPENIKKQKDFGQNPKNMKQVNIMGKAVPAVLPKNIVTRINL